MRRIRPDCSDAVLELFSRALSPELTRRPSTASELGEWFRAARMELAA